MTRFIAALLVSAALAAPSFAEVTEGDPAPAFSLPDQYGEVHALEDFEGRWLVVFFYPKAGTPGCTTEACSFRDNIYALRGAGAEVVGISMDSIDEQKAFSDEYRLPYAILSDEDGTVSEAFGVRRSFGGADIANRESFLVGPDGVIVKHYARVDPDTHVAEVVADLEQRTGAD
ncbi:MAG: peroxiredoxin [Wenzhouxiangellaceae bacterium]|nr:peroxiredoxin [Wenzhouxiangellaceae bacterium]